MHKIIVYCLLLFCITTHAQKPLHSKGFLQAGKFQVYYEQQGKGLPLVLLHAGLQNHQMWAAQVADLSKHFTVITPDLPYHGQTTGVDTGMAAGEVIRILLDSLHQQQVFIGGLSMGAAIVQDFIIAHPDRVRKVILMASGVNGYEEKFPIDSLSMAWYPVFAQALEKGDTARAALEFSKAWGEGIHQKGDQLTKSSSQYVYRTTLATLKRHRMQHWPKLQTQPLAVDQIHNIKVPVLIIHGNEDLPFINTASRYLEQHIKGAQRVELPGVAHMINLERPRDINRIIKDFLTEQ